MRVQALGTIRYGSNGFKHKGDEFSLTDEEATEKSKKGLVKILGETATAVAEKRAEKENK